MGPDRWFEFGHMGHGERIPGRGSDLVNKYLPRAYLEPGRGGGFWGHTDGLGL